MTQEIATPENEVPQDENTPEPATSQGKTEGQNTGRDDVIQMTPAQLKERLARTEKSVLSGVLEALGVDSLDTLKSTLEADKKRKEAEMTETEKLQVQLDAMKQSIAEKDTALAQVNQARLDEKRDNGLLQLLSKAHDPQKVLVLIKAEKADTVAGLISEDGKFNSEQAQSLVSEYAGANAYLFTSGSPGSPSNSGGRVPQPDLKETEKEVNRKFGRL